MSSFNPPVIPEFVPIPNPLGKTEVDAAELQLARDLQLIAPVHCYASAQQYLARGGVAHVPQGSAGKPWSDPAGWNPNVPQQTYIVLTGGILTPAQLVHDETASLLSYGATTFFGQYASRFPEIPQMRGVTLRRDEMLRLNLVAPAEISYPINPHGEWAYRVNPKTRKIEAFKWQEYSQRNKSDAEEKAGQGGNMPWPEIWERLIGIQFSGASDAEKKRLFLELAAK